MRFHVVALGAMLLAIPASWAQNKGDAEYTITVDGNIRSTVNPGGKAGRYVTAQFKVTRGNTDTLVKVLPDTDKFVVYEDGKLVKTFDLEAPESGPLTTILAMDISGSMEKNNRIEQSRRAGQIFLQKLHEGADCGLILFDHRMFLKEPPAKDPKQFAAHREVIRGHIASATPRGGTAYIDATAESLEMLKGIRGRRAVVVMTDGVDLNSKKKLEEVIEMAQAAEVPVYTLGVGEPGKNDPVTTVLVLDHSGSMSAKANRSDKLGKIGALREAGVRFVESIRPGVRTTLLPFSDRPEKPEPFTDNKEHLRKGVQGLQAKGETALFDAVYDGLMTLRADTEQTAEAGKPIGKRAIVAMTDGIDNMSRRRVDQVIQLAKETQTPLYMLGFGASNQIDAPVMQRMAEETGGKFYHATDAEKLIDIFENLSIQLHDDGIDEVSLKKLAEQTGGKYYLARNVDDLGLMYQRVAEELQTTFRITFPSWRQQSDGTVSKVEIAVKRGDVLVSNVASGEHSRHGMIAAQMHPGIYLSLLVLIGGLLVLPGGVRRLYRTVGG